MTDQSPQVVTVIDRGATSTPTDQSIAVTPGKASNLKVNIVTPLTNILVRAARTFLQTMLGLMMASMTGAASTILPPGDFGHLAYVCAGLSIASTGICVIQNIIELLARLDQSSPTLRG